MKRVIIFLSIFLVSQSDLHSQSDTVSLLECLLAARHQTAASNNFSILADIAALKTANANATYLPALSAYGRAWYQSDATTVNFGPQSLEVDRFQYNTGLEITQKIYDGGLAMKTKELEKANLISESGKIEIDLYQLNSQIADLFYNTILLGKSRSVLNLKEEVILRKVKEMDLAYSNGLVRRNDLEKMNAELLQVQKQILDLEKSLHQASAALSLYTGISIGPGTILLNQEFPGTQPNTERPEFKYFNSELTRIENLAEIQNVRKRPVISLYGQAGYSYPGLNFFENQSDYYYIVGARLSWSVFDWGQNKNESRAILKQKAFIESRRDDFSRNRAISIEKETIGQKQLKELIDIDEKLILQRAAITRGSETALLNGVVNSAVYLEDLNAEMAARIDMEVHKIQFERSVVQNALLEGIEISNQ